MKKQGTLLFTLFTAIDILLGFGSLILLDRGSIWFVLPFVLMLINLLFARKQGELVARLDYPKK